MGSLTPGAKYIYEKADGITYAREVGAPHNERFEIGRDNWSHQEMLDTFPQITKLGKEKSLAFIF